MGVKGLWKLVEGCYTTEIPKKQRLAVDASIWLYKYKNIPQASIIYSFTKRIINLLYHDNTLYFVFDSKAPMEKLKTIIKRNEDKLRNEIKAHFDKIRNNKTCSECKVLYKMCDHGREVDFDEMKEIEDVVNYKLKNHDFNWGDEESDVEFDKLTFLENFEDRYGINVKRMKYGEKDAELGTSFEDFLPKNFESFSLAKKLSILEEIRKTDAFTTLKNDQMSSEEFSKYQLRKTERAYGIQRLINEISNTKQKRILGDCGSYYELQYEEYRQNEKKEEEVDHEFENFLKEEDTTRKKPVKEGIEKKIGEGEKEKRKSNFFSELNSIFLDDNKVENFLTQNKIEENKSTVEVRVAHHDFTETPINEMKEVSNCDTTYGNKIKDTKKRRSENRNNVKSIGNVVEKINSKTEINDFESLNEVRNEEDITKEKIEIAESSTSKVNKEEKEEAQSNEMEKIETRIDYYINDRIKSIESSIQKRTTGLMNEVQAITALLKRILNLLGVVYIDAPYEADSQLGYLNNDDRDDMTTYGANSSHDAQMGYLSNSDRGEMTTYWAKSSNDEKLLTLEENHVFNGKIYNLKVDAIITEDNDAFLFGASKIYKDYFKNPKLYTMESIKKNLKLNREDLLKLSIFLGNDYTVGIRGIGPIKAYDILRKKCEIEYNEDYFKGEYEKIHKIYFNGVVKKSGLRIKAQYVINDVKNFLEDNFLNNRQVDELVFYLRKIRKKSLIKY